MAVYLYTRCSTDTQNTGNQVHALLQRFPDAEIVEETASGAKHRPRLEQLLLELREGDTLVVAALDRLSRRCGELVRLLDSFTERRITFVSVREGIDLGSMGGRFVAQVFSALAELERGIIAERTRTALAAKRAEGVKLGRPTGISKERAEGTSRALQLAASGMGLKAVSKAIGIPRSTMARYLKNARKSPAA